MLKIFPLIHQFFESKSSEQSAIKLDSCFTVTFIPYHHSSEAFLERGK